MEHDEQLAKNAVEIPPLPSIEEDDQRTAPLYQKASIEEIKTRREEARKDADSQHARIRDTWVTVAGLILILILIFGYFYAVQFSQKNDYTASLLNLLNSVVMLIIGYIFGTKITHR